MIRPKDIRNRTRASGYNYVQYHVDRDRSTRSHPFRAEEGSRVGSRWRGPRRATALEAAQDYCNYMNGKGATPAPQLRSAGHKGKRSSLPSDPEVRAALGVLRDARGQRRGEQGYVYLVIEVNKGGGLTYGKIGYSTNPQARVAELQTGNPRKLRLHLSKPGTLADEAALHAKYAKQNVLQEWFRLTKPLLLEWDAEHYVKEDAA